MNYDQIAAQMEPTTSFRSVCQNESRNYGTDGSDQRPFFALYLEDMIQLYNMTVRRIVEERNAVKDEGAKLTQAAKE